MFVPHMIPYLVLSWQAIASNTMASFDWTIEEFAIWIMLALQMTVKVSLSVECTTTAHVEAYVLSSYACQQEAHRIVLRPHLGWLLDVGETAVINRASSSSSSTACCDQSVWFVSIRLIEVVRNIAASLSSSSSLTDE